MSNYFAALEIDATSLNKVSIKILKIEFMIEKPYLTQWNNDKRCIGDYSQQFRINCTKIAIVSITDYTDISITTFFTGRLSVDVAEFRWSNTSKPKLSEKCSISVVLRKYWINIGRSNCVSLIMELQTKVVIVIFSVKWQFVEGKALFAQILQVILTCKQRMA